WPERRKRLDEVGAVWPVADDVELAAVDINGVPGEYSIVPGSDPCCVLMFLHGGGYCSGSIQNHRRLVTPAGRTTNIPAPSRPASRIASPRSRLPRRRSRVAVRPGDFGDITVSPPRTLRSVVSGGVPDCPWLGWGGWGMGKRSFPPALGSYRLGRT